MADIQANIGIGVDTSQALASIRQLQREISVFHTLMAKGGAKAAAESMNLQQNLVNSINETGKFSAGMTRISSSTESFTNALEKNKLSMGQYFRYAGGASKSFGKMFSREFNTISQVAQERVKDLQTQYISMGRDANGALQSIKVRPLALDMNNLGTKVQLAAQKQQLFNQLMKQGTTNLLNFGKNTQWAGRQLMVGFTIPLTIFGATAVREFQKIEDQVVKFRRVYGDMFNTDAETEKALDNVRQLAEEFTKYGIAVEKTIGLAAKAAQMGNTGAALTEQVTQATRLAVLGGLEQQEALDTTISLTNAFGIAAEDLAGKIAFLNAAENQTILSIEDFNTAIPLSGSVVRQLGGDVEDLAVLLTAMREGGINASQAGNALKSSLGRLIAPSRNAKETLGSFGIDVLGIVNNNAGDLMGTINTLAYSLDELDPLSRARSIEALFGKFQFARMSTLFSNIVRDGSQASKVLGLTANSTAELAIIAERELKRVEESPAFKLQKQMEQLKSALAPIGAEFVKAILPIVEFGTKILKAFNNMGEGGKQFVVVLTAIAGVVAPAALMAFGLVANGIANLIKFFQFLGTAFGMLSGKSTMLGGQTEYMTQQQLEAAAVAASLGQSHSNLTQIFTAEASAISGLVAQYNAAIRAQRQLSIGQTAKGVAAMPTGPTPKKYAKGVTMVPGPKGKGDIVPAMLSPGEAVIPVDQTAKYFPLIRGIVADNLPGYENSNVSVGNKTLPVRGQVTEGLQKLIVRLEAGEELAPGIIDLVVKKLEGAAVSANSLKNAIQSVNKETQDLVRLTQTVADVMPDTESKTGIIASHGAAPKTISPEQSKAIGEQLPEGTLRTGMLQAASEGRSTGAYSELVFGEPASANENLLTGKERGAWWQDNPEKTSSFLQEGGYVDLEDPQQSADYDQFSSHVAAELSKAGLEGVSESDFHKIVADGIANMADGAAKEGMQRAAETSKAIAPGGASEKKRLEVGKGQSLNLESLSLQEESGTGSYQGKTKKIREEFSRESDDFTKGVITERVSDLQEEDMSGIEDVGRNVIKSVEHSMKSEAQMNSPSKKFWEIGKNIVASTASGAQEAMTKLKGKAIEVGQGIGEKIDNSPVAQRAANYLSGGDLDDKINVTRAMADGEMENIRTAKAINQDLYDKGLITEDMQQTALGQAQGITPVRVVDGKLDIGDNSIDGLANASDKASQAADENRLQEKTLRDQRAASEEATEATNNLATTTENKKKQDEAAIKEQKRQGRQALAGKAMAGLGTLSVAAGMATQVEGPIGQIAQAVVGPLAAMTGILPILISLGPVFGGLAAVVGLGVGALLLWNSTMNKAREESIRLADAMGTSSDAIQKFADFAGKVTSTEIMNSQRISEATPFGVQAGKTSFGESFFGSDEGTKFAEDIQTSLLEIGRDRTLNKVYQQLGSAVSSGALSSLEAQSIAQALYGELEDSTFSLELNGKLLDLLGPNGNNLLEDPLSVSLNLIVTQQENLDEIIAEGPATYVDSWEKASEEVADIIADEGPLSMAYWSQMGNVWKTLFGFGVAEDNIERASELIIGYRDLVQGSQQAIDNLQISYDQKIADALNIGDTALADELREQLLADQQEIINKQQEAFQGFKTMFAENPAEAVRGMKEALATVYSGDELKRARDTFDELDSKLSSVVGEEKVAELQFMLTSGTFSVDNMMGIIDNFSDQPDVIDKVIRLGTDRSSAEAKQVADIISLIQNPETQAGVLSVFDESNMQEFKDNLQAYQAAANIGSLVPFEESDFLINLLYSDPAAAYQIQSDLDRLEQQAAAGPITNEFAIGLIGEEAFAAIAFMWDGLEEDDKKTALYSIITTLGVDFENPEAESWLENMGGFTFGGGTVGEDDQTGAAAAIAERAVSSRTFAPFDQGDDGGESGASGATKSVDSLITKLRDLRMATIDMKKGWEGMQETLSKIFAGDGKGFDVFNGLSNQIRKMGVGENLIEMIVGMDPDEYAKRKDELFTFDAAGNITGTTAKLKNLSSAFNAIAIGEYVNSQQAFIENTKNQFNAMNTLVASGMSLADAYELVQDEALAAAIAMGATRAEIDEIIRITSLMKEQQRRSEREQERINTSKAVKETNKDFENQVKVLNKLAKAQGQYSDAQINAMMSDKNLQAIFLDPSIDPKALENALKNAEQQANLEVQIALKTAAGQEAKFNEYAAEVSDYFAREEALINLNFEVATADDSKIVEDAQNQIADIQYKLDDYNAELEQISWIEDDINEKYDKRSEALENIAETNDRIAQQQKAQLNIADALSQGDIAAAARAAQELRDQQATNAQEDQKSMLDRARQAELGAVRGPGGMTREELEDQITALERQMFLIEEQSLEPAQERIRLAEVTKNLAIERLELEGKSRMEWEQISAATSQAAMDMEAMVLAARKASALSEFIRTGEKGADWDELFPQPKAAAAPAPSSGGGGGGGGGGGSAPAPAPAPTPTPAKTTPKVVQPGPAVSQAIQNVVTAQKALTKTKTAPAISIRQVEAAAAKVTSAKSRLRAAELAASKPSSSAYLFRANGGMIIPKRMNVGGKVKGYAAGGYQSLGSDNIPAMLTPGEFVVRKRAVQNFGMENLEKINSGTYNDGSVYNYNLAVNVNSDSDPSRIARAVITQIKRVDSQRIRNNKL